MLDPDLNYFTPIKNDSLTDIELEPQNLHQLLLEVREVYLVYCKGASGLV